jgi:hypothetical protein
VAVAFAKVWPDAAGVLYAITGERLSVAETIRVFAVPELVPAGNNDERKGIGHWAKS